MSVAASQAAEARDIMKSIAAPFEGMALVKGGMVHPYACPAGVWTIGRGNTRYLDGRAVAPDDPPISLEAAERLFLLSLDAYLFGVLKCSPGLAKEPAAWGAIADFAFNCGVPRYRASTLRRKVDAEDWDGAAQELMKWTRAGGRVLRGLVLRREAEAKFLPR